MVGSPTYCFLVHMGESLPINLNREENYNKVFSLSYPSKDKTIDERKLSKRILWSLRASLFKKIIIFKVFQNLVKILLVEI